MNHARERSLYRFLVGRSAGKASLGRPRPRWEYNNKMDLREIGWSDMDWIHLALLTEQLRDFMNREVKFRIS
jgi:hypothetical protein